MSKDSEMSAPELPAYERLEQNVPQAGYLPMAHHPPQQMQTPVSVVMSNMPQAPMAVGPKPQMMVCPNCRNTIKTATKTEAVTKTHLMALLLCCCLCWPCVCLPYCMNSCQNVNHYCPNCDTYLGAYQH